MNKFALKRRILIVGEGRETEYNYFVGFRSAFEKDLEALATSISVARGKGGDARGIVDNAIRAASNFGPNRKRGDRVFLLLDSEGTGSVPGHGRLPELPNAEKLARKNGIEIVYSSPSFEYWLLCHFENIPRAQFNDCNAVIADLDKQSRWKSVCNTKYDKADQSIFDRLEHLLNSARAQALEIDLHHLQTASASRPRNPSTQVYELIAILIGARTGEKCPIAGSWKLVDDGSVAIQLNKGIKMPTHKGNAAHWRL